MALSKLNFIPFKPDHVQQMDLRPWDKKFLSFSPELSLASADIFARNGVAYTGTCGEGIVGAGGIVRILPGNYEMWAYTTNLFPKYAMSIHRFAKRYIGSFFSQPIVRRLQVLVDTQNRPAVQWAFHLGLECRHRLDCYGPEGQTFLMFEKTK